MLAGGEGTTTTTKTNSFFEWGGLVVRVTSESVNPDEKKGRRPGKSQPIMHIAHRTSKT